MTAKYAPLIGINYKADASNELHGCVNDIYAIKDYLLSKRNYSASDVVCLIEGDANRNTILLEFSQLMLKSHHASENWFHYSGHGSSTYDYSGDEVDGRDETIIPFDYQRAGAITDDVLHSYLQYISNRCKAFFIMDCCHSGTIFDLQFSFENGKLEERKDYRQGGSGDIICISGCRDTEVSADALISSRFQGACTASSTMRAAWQERL